MTVAYFEDHPTDPDKVIFRKPPLDQGPDYERGFVDGMLYQTQSSVYKAVNAVSQPEQKSVAMADYMALTEKYVALKAAQPNFCPRCGKRLGINDWDIHTCTPPQRTWVGLTEEEMHGCWDSPLTPLGMKHARMIEAKLKEKNI